MCIRDRVADAREHGVEVLPVDVNHSDWDCLIEETQKFPLLGVRGLPEATDAETGEENGKKQNPHPAYGHLLPKGEGTAHPLRLGFRMLSGLRADHAEQIMHARRDGPFTSVSDFTRRTGLGSATITLLSKADAFGSLEQDRRTALWQALAQEKKPLHQPLFDTLDATDDAISNLPTMTLQQNVVEDYRAFGLSLKAHPMSFYREHLDQLKIMPNGQLAEGRNNQFIRVAGLVIMRQRPSTAKGITFVTIEDETGTANLVVFQNIWERHYKIARKSPAWIAYGKLEMKHNVIHVVVSRLEDMSDRLEDHGIKSRDFR